jgi:hypothetical protein
MNDLWRDLFGSNHKISLVLSILGIHNDDQEANGQRFQSVFDSAEGEVHELLRDGRGAIRIGTPWNGDA